MREKCLLRKFPYSVRIQEDAGQKKSSVFGRFSRSDDFQTYALNKEGTMICAFTSWYGIIDQKIIKHSQEVNKKLNLANQAILLFEACLVQ